MDSIHAELPLLYHNLRKCLNMLIDIVEGEDRLHEYNWIIKYIFIIIYLIGSNTLPLLHIFKVTIIKQARTGLKNFVMINVTIKQYKMNTDENNTNLYNSSQNGLSAILKTFLGKGTIV